MTGTTIAQMIPIAISPVLTRIYTPEDFGILALFASITTIFASVANARYEMAIMLPEEEDEAYTVAVLGMVISSFLSIILLVVVFFYSEDIAIILGNKEIAPWLYLSPVSIWIISLFNVLNYMNTRLREYKRISQANIIRSIVLSSFQLGVGLIKGGGAGLILGYVFSSMFACLMFKGAVRKTRILISELKYVSVKYSKFPKYSLAAGLANTLSLNLHGVFISIFYNVTTLGMYSLVQRVLEVPMTIIGGTISQVYFEMASSSRKKVGNIKKIFLETLKKLILISVLPFTAIYFIAEDLFRVVFGEDWVVAGEYCKILVPLFFIRFIVAPLTVSNSIIGANKKGLIFNIIFLLIVSGVYMISGLMEFEFFKLLILLVICQIVFYFSFLFSIYQSINDEC